MINTDSSGKLITDPDPVANPGRQKVLADPDLDGTWANFDDFRLRREP